jgi:hypothetical protein
MTVINNLIKNNMSKVSNAGECPAVKPETMTDGVPFDRNVNIEPTKVELCSPIKKSQKGKLLGAVLNFVGGGEAKPDGTKEDFKMWTSFDHLFGSTKKTTKVHGKQVNLFELFYDNVKCQFVGACKVGVKEGQWFLAEA